MSVVTPTTPGIPSDPIPAESVASGALGTRSTLDLRTKWGAWLLGRIGRTVAAALTAATPPKIMIRRTHSNDGTLHPANSYDLVGNTLAAIKGTITATLTIGVTSCTITGGASFAAGDIVCMSNGASRVEFAEIAFMTSTTIASLTAPLKLAHAASDNICTLSDIFPPIFIPGGSTYEVRSNNGAGGQTCIFECLAETYDSDTIT